MRASLGEKAARKGLGLKTDSLGSGTKGKTRAWLCCLASFYLIKVPLLSCGSKCTFIYFYQFCKDQYLEGLKNRDRARNVLLKTLPQVFTKKES